MCVSAFGWTNVYSEETRERNANVGKWPALPASYPLPARTQTLIRVFVLEGDHIFIEEVVHFTLIYIAH